MANCHDSLIIFSEALNITENTKVKLVTASRTVREHIKKQCSEKGYPLIRFKVQGSKKIGTLIRRYGEESDIDIGVYFYPKPSIKPESLMKAVHKFFTDGHSSRTQPELKKKCVRVLYADSFHIDLPIFYLENPQGRGKCYLATRTDGWIKSDPREFEEWFIERGGKDKVQLIRIVRYLKAWCHHIASEVRVPQGVALTTMAGSMYKPNVRDDKALLQVLKTMHKTLSQRWSCSMPVPPKDELLIRFSQSDQDYFMLRLNLFIIDSEKAIKNQDEREASKLWKKHLGRHYQIIR